MNRLIITLYILFSGIMLFAQDPDQILIKNNEDLTKLQLDEYYEFEVWGDADFPFLDVAEIEWKIKDVDNSNDEYTKQTFNFSNQHIFFSVGEIEVTVKVTDNDQVVHNLFKKFKVKPEANFRVRGQGSYRVGDEINFNNLSNVGADVNGQLPEGNYCWSWKNTDIGDQNNRCYTTIIRYQNPDDEISGFTGITYNTPGSKLVVLKVTVNGVENTIEKTIEIDEAPELHITKVNLSHFCWDYELNDGTIDNEPAQLEVFAYGGIKPYTFEWEAYDIDKESDGIPNNEWVSSQVYLDDHTISNPKITNYFTGYKTGDVLFRVTVTDDVNQSKRVNVGWERKDYNTQGPKLVIRDGTGDLGREPSGLVNWLSPDLWNTYTDNRNNQLHYPVKVDAGSQYLNSMHFRVQNLGCRATTGNEVVRLYWTNSNASGGWPTSFQPNDGDEVTEPLGKDLPIINPGVTHIDYVDYNVDPHWLGIGTYDLGKICMYARILENELANQVDGSSDPGMFEGPKVWENSNNHKEITPRNSTASFFELDPISIEPSLGKRLFQTLNKEPEEDKSPTDPGNDGNGTIVGKVEDVTVSNILINLGDYSEEAFALPDFELRGNSFEEIGTIYMYIQKELKQKIDASSTIEMCGIVFQNDTVAILDFSDTAESSYNEVGIYNIDWAPDEQYAINLKFEVADSINIFSPGYNVYEIIQTDDVTDDTVGMFTRTVFLANEPFDSFEIRTVTLSSSGSKTALKEPSLNNVFEVFPNPFEDYVTIRIKETNEKEILDIRLINSSGKLILANSVKGKSLFKLKTIDIPPGIYLIEIYDEKGLIGVEKLIHK